MMDETVLSISLPLDHDGFLLRQCHTCDREFMWLPSEDGEPAEPGGYYCPYCAIQSHSWETDSQNAEIEALAMHEVVEPAIDKMLSEFGRNVRGPGISVEVQTSGKSPAPEQLPSVEISTMRRVDFSCHSSEPVKVTPQWDRPVYCLVCGSQADTAG
jgi:hypothetical protein